MKKMICWLLAVLLVAGLFSGCKKTEEPESLQDSLQTKTETDTPEQPQTPEAPSAAEDPSAPTEPSEPAEPSAAGELYDAGNVTVLIPEGWKAFPDLDVFAEEEGAMDPDILNVSKGGQTDLDLLTKPYVRINYFGPDILMMKPDSSWYDNVSDIEPFTTGEHQWFGFSCESLGTPLTILWCEEGDVQYQATLTLGSGAEAISHEDADVQAILASVTPSAPGAASTDAEPEQEPESESLWAGQWYGWWCIRYASGQYEQMNDIAWDLCAEIEDYEDGTGYITMWDSETARDLPLVRGYVNFDDTVMTADYCTFFDGGQWLPNVVDVEPVDFDDWYVDAADSSVSHFDSMLEIEGYYEDPNNSENYFTY